MYEKAKDDGSSQDISVVQSNNDGESEIVGQRGTHRGLKSRHAQMLALGGTIGTGLFVGSGQGLHMGGPVTLLLCYCFITFLVFGIVACTTEMSSYLPVSGVSMAYYGDRFFSKSMGFALGWMYWYIFSITVPAEITAAGLVIQYWNPPVNIAVWITLLLVVIIGLNCFPVDVFGETEFWFASIKVLGITGLLIMAVVLIFGGGPTHDRLGFRYWEQPGPVNEYIVTGDSGRLIAFISTACFSVFAFAFAPELLVMTGGEMESPRYNLPIAGKRYFYRLIVFYVAGAFALGMIVSSDDPLLLGGGSGAGASPWAIAAKRAGIKGLDSIINAVILTSAWSSGNSYLYMASRSLYSMAISGNAPKIFMKCTKSGIPYNAVAASATFSLLAYLNVSSSGSTVFNWFANLINTGAYTSWIMVCLIYLRFRKATAVQKITDLPFRSRFNPYMAYVSGTLFLILLLLSGITNFLPGHWNTSNFLTAYIGIVIFIALFLGHKLIVVKEEEPWVRSIDKIDMTSGLAEILADERIPVIEKGWRGILRKIWG